MHLQDHLVNRSVGSRLAPCVQTVEKRQHPPVGAHHVGPEAGRSRCGRPPAPAPRAGGRQARAAGSGPRRSARIPPCASRPEGARKRAVPAGLSRHPPGGPPRLWPHDRGRWGFGEGHQPAPRSAVRCRRKKPGLASMPREHVVEAQPQQVCIRWRDLGGSGGAFSSEQTRQYGPKDHSRSRPRCVFAMAPFRWQYNPYVDVSRRFRPARTPQSALGIDPAADRPPVYQSGTKSGAGHSL